MYYKDLSTKDLDDPADQFAWLDSQLSTAARNNEKVSSGVTNYFQATLVYTRIVGPY